MYKQTFDNQPEKYYISYNHKEAKLKILIPLNNIEI